MIVTVISRLKSVSVLETFRKPTPKFPLQVWYGVLIDILLQLVRVIINSQYVYMHAVEYRRLVTIVISQATKLVSLYHTYRGRRLG